MFHSIHTDNPSKLYFDQLLEAIQRIVKDALIEAANSRQGPEGYKPDAECLNEVECRSRDGFIASSANRGGLIYQNFCTLSDYWGGGYVPRHAKAAQYIKNQINSSLKQAQEACYDEFEPLCLDLGIVPDDIHPIILDEYLKTSEALTPDQKSQLNSLIQSISDLETESLSDEQSTVMHEFRFMFHGKSKGIYSASVSAAINVEAPYHRSHISWMPNAFCEGAKEVTITWKTPNGLKRSLAKALKEVSEAIF